MTERSGMHEAGDELDEDVARALSAARKEVADKGGAAKVGAAFARFLQEDDFHRETGLVREDLAPFARPVLMLTALTLLDAWKAAPDDMPDRDVVAALSRRVYVGTAMLVSPEEVRQLVARHTGEDGRPEEAAMRAAIEERAHMAAQSWEALKSTPAHGD